MQYMLMFHENQEALAARNDAERAPAYWGAWMSYVGAMQASGVVVSGGGLQPPDTATTVRMKGEQRLVQDGPFADTKEQLGGFFVIDVPDLDAALAWAARSPAAHSGGVEVRPVLPPRGN